MKSNFVLLLLMITFFLTSATAAQKQTESCQNINSKAEASNCMKYWAAEILPSYEDKNKTHLISASSYKKQLAKQVLGWTDQDQKENLAALDKADYIGMVAQYQDETHFYYFTLTNGKNTQPIQIMDFNPVDIEGSSLGDEIENTTDDDMPRFYPEIIKTFFLGTSSKRFPYVLDSIMVGIDSI